MSLVGEEGVVAVVGLRVAGEFEPVAGVLEPVELDELAICNIRSSYSYNFLLFAVGLGPIGLGPVLVLGPPVLVLGPVLVLVLQCTK